MSSISQKLVRGAAIGFLSLVPALGGWSQAAPLPQETLTCPASIKVTESAAPMQGWKSSSSTVERKFERISIYNGKDGEKEFELAPDVQMEQGKAVVQTWHLKGYRTMNLFMRCRYRGTSVVVSADLPLPIDTCTFTFEIDKKGRITGKPRMSCR
jgi:hypothetical protein